MIIKRLKCYYLRKIRPLRYAEKIGVNMPGGGYFFTGILIGAQSHGS